MSAASDTRFRLKTPDFGSITTVPLGSLPFAAAFMDTSGVVQGCNREWLDAYPGAGPAASLQQTASAIWDDPPRMEALLAAIPEILRGASPRFDQQSGRVGISVTPCGPGALVVCQKLETATEEPATAQSQKMETVGRLVGGVVHDFANLITMIGGYADILLNRIGSKDPLRPELDEIGKAANRGARLTSQLLGFTRGKASQPKVIDLNVVVLEIERMLRPIIGEDVEFEIALTPALGKVVVDPGQMEQVIMNLILNARDAMPRGGRIRIETSNGELDEEAARLHAMEQGPAVRLSVSDNGQGIAPDAMEHVFEPFFTTKENGKGTGLGLSTVQRIVKESAGDIQVRSAPGEGATFSIWLPRAKQAGDVGDAAALERQSPRGSETVLLVEDEEGVRRLLMHVLHKRGYNVLEACNGEEALRIFKGRAPEIDLVLTDIVMPNMSGRELAEEVRRISPEMKVVFMSGYTDDVLVRTGALSPGMSFLQKPLRPEALAAKLREALDSPARPFNPR